jgi:hypothetical protein
MAAQSIKLHKISTALKYASPLCKGRVSLPRSSPGMPRPRGKRVFPLWLSKVGEQKILAITYLAPKVPNVMLDSDMRILILGPPSYHTPHKEIFEAFPPVSSPSCNGRG